MRPFRANRLFLACAVTLISATMPAAGAFAQQAAATGEKADEAPVAEEKPAPYDSRLLRLAEVMGSIHYLRTLCGQTDGAWRESMQKLLDAEAAAEPRRRERLTAGFNRGFRSFASVYTSCTLPAVQAEENYRAEGATLVSEIVARFGN